MSSYEAIYEEFAAIDPADYQNVIRENYVAVSKSGNRLLLNMIIAGVIRADAVLSKKEYDILKPAFEKMFGPMSIGRASDIINQYRPSEDQVKLAISDFKCLPEGVADGIILIALMFSNIDGNIAEKELDYIRMFAN